MTINVCCTYLQLSAPNTYSPVLMSKHVGDMQRMFLYINASCKCCKAVMNEVFGVFFMSNLENNTVH